jgi:hypothetical protein
MASKKTMWWKCQGGKVIEILSDHIKTKGKNFNGVCVSACLSYLGIKPNEYKFTWSQRTGNKAALAIIRRKGYNVRSRKTVFKKAKTVSQLKKLVAKYDDYTKNVWYYVHVPSHVLLLDSKGRVVVDTAPRKRDVRRVIAVEAVFVA